MIHLATLPPGVSNSLITKVTHICDFAPLCRLFVGKSYFSLCSFACFAFLATLVLLSLCCCRFCSFFFFSSLPSSFADSPILSRHGSPWILLTHFSSNSIVFCRCVTMGSPCSPGFGPLSLIILTCLRTGWIAFPVVTFQQTSPCLPSQTLLVLLPVSCIDIYRSGKVWLLHDPPLSQDVLGWLVNKVQVQLFFRHLKGNFKGEHFHSASPPQWIFYNQSLCAPFAKFIADKILQYLSTSAISAWGKVGGVDPPHLFMPLTVEPSKPTLFNDNRFLNLWTADA